MTVAEIERIGTPQISRQDARKAFLEYRRAVIDEKDPARRKEYDGLMKGYRAIAKGLQVVDVAHVLQVAGLQHDTCYPRLAICRADATTCFVDMREDGSATFRANKQPSTWGRTASADLVRCSAATFPRFVIGWHDGKRFRDGRPSAWTTVASALVPIVPAGLHPKAHLRNYHILWDAVWTPEPPKDPLLLKHLAGQLYAIVAAWDLTPLEQAVLRGRL